MKALMIIAAIASSHTQADNAKTIRFINSHLVLLEECEQARQHEFFKQPANGGASLVITCVPLG